MKRNTSEYLIKPKGYIDCSDRQLERAIRELLVARGEAWRDAALKSRWCPWEKLKEVHRSVWKWDDLYLRTIIYLAIERGNRCLCRSLLREAILGSLEYSTRDVQRGIHEFIDSHLNSLYSGYEFGWEEEQLLYEKVVEFEVGTLQVVSDEGCYYCEYTTSFDGDRIAGRAYFSFRNGVLRYLDLLDYDRLIVPGDYSEFVFVQ